MRWIVGLAFVASALQQPGTPIGTPLAGREQTIVAVAGDSWRSLGARHGVEPSVLARRNGSTVSRAIAAGSEVVVDNRHVVPSGMNELDLVVNVPQRMVFVRRAGEVLAFPVAVGSAGWQTPLGDFTIVEKEVDPTWDVPVSIQEEMRREGKPVLTSVPPGPANPLGRHWVRTSFPGVGLHGTNAPWSIFQAVTHGCLRMHPDDVAVLFDAVATGARGRMLYEPVLAAVTEDGRVWLEVHRDVYRRAPVTLAEAQRRLAALGVLDRADARAIDAAIRAREGVAIDVTRKVPHGREK